MLKKFLNRFRRKPAPAKADKAPSVKGRLPVGSTSKGPLAKLIRGEPKDVGELAAEMDKDYQVQLAVLVLKANIQSVPVTITAEGDDPRLQALAAQLATLWHKHLSDMLDFIGKGRVAFEKCWAYSESANVNYIESLDPLPFEHTEMRLGAEGVFEGITLTIDKDEAVDIDAAKSWWLALDPTPLEPHGRSRYLGAPQAVWKERKETREQLATFISRFVVRGGIGYAPETETDEYGRVHDAMQILQELVENIYSGGTVILPNIWKNVGGQWVREYEFTESPTTLDPSPLLGVIDAGDTAQLRAFGIPEKTLTEGDSVGSFAMVKQQTLALYAVIEGILSQCVGSFQRYVIDKTIAVNYLPEDRARIVATYPKLTERPDSVISQVAQGLLTTQTNDLVASGAIDLPKVLKQAGVPTTPNAQEKLAEFAKTKLAARPPGPMDAANETPSSVRDLAAPVNAGPVPECPSRDALTSAVLQQLGGLYDELYRLIETRHWDAVWPLIGSIRELQIESTAAAKVLGLISPWRPSLVDPPAGSGATQRPVRELAGNPGELELRDLSIVAPSPAPPGGGRGGWHFPWLDAAVTWLRRKAVVTSSELQQIPQTERANVFSAPGINDREWLNGLKQRLATSVREGHSIREFRADIDETLGSNGLSQPQMETVFRTNVHQAFVAGWDSIITRTAVANEFGYVMLVATHDTRCRPTHAAMDGFVCSVTDPAYALLRRLLSDYNCRCMTISLNEEQAKARGIKTIADVPPEVLAQYGA